MYSALAVPSRRRLLEVLRSAGGHLDVPALAVATGLHPSTVRFHLDVLTRVGLVEHRHDRRGGRGRPRVVYAPTSDTGHEHGYRLLAEMLASHLDQASDDGWAETAGRSWAQRIAPRAARRSGGDVTAVTRHVVTTFAEMGFDPAVTGQGRHTRVDLRACPFRDVARQHPAVVCAVHRGLLRGLVEQHSVDGVGAELTPFVEPQLCVVDIRAGDGATAP